MAKPYITHKLLNTKQKEKILKTVKKKKKKKRKERKTGYIKAKLKINSISCIRNYSRQNAMK